MFTCVLWRYSHKKLYPNLSEDADRVGGQLRGDRDRVPLQWRNQIWQSLEEGAGRRCSECALDYEAHRKVRRPEHVREKCRSEGSKRVAHADAASSSSSFVLRPTSTF